MTDLFLSAAVDLPYRSGSGAAKTQTPKLVRAPLVTQEVLEGVIKKSAFNPTDEQRAAANDYASIVKTKGCAKQKETSIRDIFYARNLGSVLGWSIFNSMHCVKINLWLRDVSAV